LIENADDILAEFGFFGRAGAGKSVPTNPDGTPRDMNEFERKIFEIVGDYPVHMDDIVRQANMDAGNVAAILMKMELEGIVRQLPGRLFVR
jgi:DNA processing protein